MSHSGSVLELLRKALVVSTKLKVSDVREWARSEIEGYTSPVPKYRRFSSILRSETIYGWEDVSFENLTSEEYRIFENRYGDVDIKRPIAEIEAWLASKGPSIMVRLSPETAQSFGLNMPTARFVPKTALATVPDQIRHYILNWSLELEQRGILGEGMTFTAVERAEAATIITNHFYAPQYQNNGQIGAMGDCAVNRSSG